MWNVRWLLVHVLDEEVSVVSAVVVSEVVVSEVAVSYTHLTLPTTPYV